MHRIIRGEKAWESCIEIVSGAFKEAHSENYAEAIGTLVKSLSKKPDLLRPIVESHLVVGTPPSVISSQVILAVVSVDDDEEVVDNNLFQDLKVLRRVTQKVLESAASDKPFVSRPAREARDIIRQLDDDSLLGLF